MLNKQEFNNQVSTQEAIKSHLSGDILQVSIGSKCLKLEYILSNEVTLSLTNSVNGSTNEITLSQKNLRLAERNKLISDFVKNDMEFEPTLRFWLNQIGICYDLFNGSQVQASFILSNKLTGKCYAHYDVNLANALVSYIKTQFSESVASKNMIASLVSEDSNEEAAMCLVRENESTFNQVKHIYDQLEDLGGIDNDDVFLDVYVCFGSVARFIKAHYPQLFETVSKVEFTAMHELLELALWEDCTIEDYKKKYA